MLTYSNFKSALKVWREYDCNEDPDFENYCKKKLQKLKKDSKLLTYRGPSGRPLAVRKIEVRRSKHVCRRSN